MEIDKWYVKVCQETQLLGTALCVGHHLYEMHKGHNADEMCKFLMRWPFDRLWASDTIWWQVLVNIDSGNSLVANRCQAIT